jgi:hypothetical protein
MTPAPTLLASYRTIYRGLEPQLRGRFARIH